ncbi:ATP-binding protein [Quadrisphaera sp. DSM 44207]|uniref:ATP-binding protein n=1 Tax=Quadrisphaera sp. DSM 44207 TaxID=1881057 RepID=UPI000891A94D|nr:ATP-binding protein [Quadrisphaera sp. DSM 44207]SDQ08038.1 hypothetical protein SAMN05428996_0411 [Quadrisphaera sp. DSM 44207]
MPVPPDDPAAAGAHLLARVARHEMVGLLGAQAHLLTAALAHLPDQPAEPGDVGEPGGRAARRLVQEALAARQQLASALELLAALDRPGDAGTAPLVEVLAGAVPGEGPAPPWLSTRVSAAAARAPVRAAPTRAVLSNVLRNAAEHREGEGPVGLTARVRGGAVLVVLDQEGRCPTAVRACLHAPAPPAGTAGLGLWLVRHLTTGMGGDVRVRSRTTPATAPPTTPPTTPGSAYWQLRLRLPVARASGAAAA